MKWIEPGLFWILLHSAWYLTVCFWKLSYRAELPHGSDTTSVQALYVFVLILGLPFQKAMQKRGWR